MIKENNNAQAFISHLSLHNTAQLLFLRCCCRCSIQQQVFYTGKFCTLFLFFLVFVSAEGKMYQVDHIYTMDMHNPWAAETRRQQRTKRRFFLIGFFSNLIAITLFITLVILVNSPEWTRDDNKDQNMQDQLEAENQIEERCRTVKQSGGWRQTAVNVLENIEASVDACSDFHEFACGGWRRRHAQHSGRTVRDLLDERLFEQMRRALDLVDERSPLKALRRLKFAYAACVDTEAMDLLQGKPLCRLLTGKGDPVLGSWPLLQTTTDSNSGAGVEFKIGHLKAEYGVDTVFFAYARPDADDNDRSFVLELSGASLPLGLGSFTGLYYLNDTHYGWIMRAYAQLVERVAQLLRKQMLNLDHPHPMVINRTEIDLMIEFEQNLARAVVSAIDDDDAEYTWSLQTLQEKIPNFDWLAMLEALLQPDVLERIVSTTGSADGDGRLRVKPTFLANVTQLLQQTNNRTVNNYLVWRLVKQSLPFLGQEYRDALRQFDRATRLRRQSAKDEEDRWRECVALINHNDHLPGLGYASGRLYAEHAFDDDEQADAEWLTEELRHTYQESVGRLRWMDPKQRHAAVGKLTSMRRYVGYPNWIRNDQRLETFYERLEFDDDHDGAFEVHFKLRSWAVRENMRSLLSGAERLDQFVGSPDTTEPWYDRQMNMLTIPIGQLQPPFYRSDFPRAVTFGGLGSALAREITHAFDPAGAKYDARNRQLNWWTAENKLRFNNITDCLSNDYEQYCYPHLNLCVNGQRTANENLADLVGLSIAYAAYRNWTIAQGEAEPSLPLVDFTPEQLFFLSYANLWCGQSSEQELINQLTTGYQAPDRYRLIGTLRNFPPFSKAFHCSPESYMNPSKRCDIYN
ncbi:Neprilysin-2 [Trichinella zimbabwensis]|uniref:Neprilysin-2 n=1 Tax=Trichinella zimbabwensis TaxID=268475 RepID=A0A0V1HRG4_9BILA|nr:Neprilysin-2 [Trichinella zimbabwensis]